MKTQFGTIVKQLREKKGMDQKQLGEIVGVSDKTVSSWEINRTEPKMGIVQQLADYFGVSTDYLLGRISSNLPIDVLQKALTDGTPVSDVIHSLFQLPPDRQRAILLVISDMAFRAMVDQYGTGEGK